MRDPNRIKPLLKQIEDYWTQHPDLRLAQIISNANSSRQKGSDTVNHDVFYLEDDELLRNLWVGHDKNR